MSSEDGGGTFLQNVGRHLQDHTASLLKDHDRQLVTVLTLI